MALNVTGKGGGTNFKPAPQGVQVAVAFKLIDLGTRETTWEGKTKKRHTIRIYFELPNALMDEGEKAGQPFVITQTFTASIGPKSTLGKFLVAWRGKPFTEAEIESFQLDKVVGKACFLNIIHATKDGETYANIGSIMPVPQGTPVPALKNEKVTFSLADFDGEVFEKLHEKMQAYIAESDEFKESGRTLKKADGTTQPGTTAPAQGTDPGDIPF